MADTTTMDCACERGEACSSCPRSCPACGSTGTLARDQRSVATAVKDRCPVCEFGKPDGHNCKRCGR